MTTMRVLSPAQHDTFEANGFLRIPHALDDETVTALRSLCLRLRREGEQAAHAGPVADDSWRDQFDLPFNEKQPRAIARGGRRRTSSRTTTRSST